MATISGRVYYSPSSYYDASDGTTLLDNEKVCLLPRSELSGIPIVLVNDSGDGACVLTDLHGEFRFDQIPEGNYRIIESFGRTDGSVSPFIYTNDFFTSLGSITPKDPTPLYIDSLGLTLNDGNAIISLTPNTFVAHVTSSSDIFTYVFIDSPVINCPLFLSNYKRTGNNLLSSADNGTFGSNEPATDAGTSPASPPDEYSDITEFEYDSYTLNSPDGGSYSLCNILNLQPFNNVWHNCADHTAGDETGSVMIVNNDNPDRYFFKETISNLDPSMTYLFSGWFLNLYRFSSYHTPAFKISIISSQNRVITEKSILDSMFSTTLPTWKEIGIIVNLKNLSASEIENNTASVTVKLTSLYQETLGNDFLVDDLSFTRVIQSNPTLEKESNFPTFPYDGALLYTCNFTNNSESTISKLIFIDPLPNGTTLTSIKIDSDENFSISINGYKKSIITTRTQLSDGIDISDILMNSTIPTTIPNYSDLQQGIIPVDAVVTFTFRIMIYNFDLLDSKPMIYNTCSCNYITSINSYSETITSNVSKVEVQYPILSVSKNISKIINNVETDLKNNSSIYSGEDFIYKITITNTGTRSQSSITIADNIDSSILPLYSTNSDCTGITKETAGPFPGSKTDIPCSDIRKINGNINNIEISNIRVPMAIVTTSAEEKTINPGIVIIRILCRAL